MTTHYDSVEYFTDPSLVSGPAPYFDRLRGKYPVVPDTPRGDSGYRMGRSERCVQGTKNHWSCVAVMGPFTPMPFVPEGDDISAQLEHHRTDPHVRAHGHDGPPQHTDDARFFPDC